MTRILIVLTLLAATIGGVQGATLNFVFTAKQLLDGIDAATNASCGNPESQGCAFYAFRVAPDGGGIIQGGSSTAPDYALKTISSLFFWTDDGANSVVSFLTRHATPLSGNFNSLVGQPATVTAGPNVAETATFTVSLDKPGLMPGQTVTWNITGYGVVLNGGVEGTGKPSVGFQLLGEAQATVPEPGTFLIAGIGLVVIGLRCRSQLDGLNNNKNRS